MGLQPQMNFRKMMRNQENGEAVLLGEEGDLPKLYPRGFYALTTLGLTEAITDNDNIVSYYYERDLLLVSPTPR